ncbi:hypothetical protein [Anaeromyxobacter oryzisoli]|uniref:hypothetical protein n=1 Tax=Anaeromyxobacter oryzisoli TaxID=2925408 RepID=UPI001F574306|nr:hypothetical protein [Anaeromyxobacter sp. SG63]
MGPTGLAAVALWALAAAPQVEVSAGVETRTYSISTSVPAPIDEPMVEARPRVGLSLGYPRTRLSATYEPRFVLSHDGSSDAMGVLHRLDLGAERAISHSWRAWLLAAAAAGTTVSARPMLDEPLEAAPALRLVRRSQTEVKAIVRGLLDPRTSVSSELTVLASGGLDPESRTVAPWVWGARLASALGWTATRLDRIDVAVAASGSRSDVGRTSVAAAALGGLSRRLTPTVDAQASVGLGLLHEDAAGATSGLRVRPSAAAGASLRALDDRLSVRADLRLAPQLSTWDGDASWRTDLSASARARLSRSWDGSVLASGARVERPDGRTTHVAETFLLATWFPRERLALTSGLWILAQRGGGDPALFATGALLGFAATGIPVGGLPVAGAPARPR